MSAKEIANAERPVETSFSKILDRGETGRFLEPLILLARHKYLITWSVVGAAIVSIIVALWIPNYYTAEGKILPPQQGPSMGVQVLGQLGDLGGLLSAASGRDLLKNPSDLYIAVLRSRTLADRIIDRFHLMSLYRKRFRVDARRRLDDLTEFIAAKDGTITVTVEDRDPSRAAEVANAYLEELDNLCKTLKVTEAGRRRLFFEHESKAAADELATAEQSLTQTEERTGIIQLDDQARVLLQAYAQLQAQISLHEVQVKSMEAYAAPANPDLAREQQQLSAMRAELARYQRGQGGRAMDEMGLEKVPAKALEYIRQLREAKYREAMLQLMRKQYEMARIDEGRDPSLIQILDRAVPPEKKSSPMRSLIVLFSCLSAFLVAVAVACVRESQEHLREDPQYLAQLELLKFYLFRGWNSPMHRS